MQGMLLLWVWAAVKSRLALRACCSNPGREIFKLSLECLGPYSLPKFQNMLKQSLKRRWLQGMSHTQFSWGQIFLRRWCVVVCPASRSRTKGVGLCCNGLFA